MNILILNHYAGSPQHGMEFRHYNFAQEWIKAGHKVMIMAGSYSHLRQKNEEVKRFSKKQVLDGVEYFWLSTPKYNGNGIKRVLSMFTFVAKGILSTRNLKKMFLPDIVVASSTYPLDIFAAKFIASRTGAKLAFEVHDIWPLTPMELGGMSATHPFIRVLQIAEDKAYKDSDFVISMLPCAKQHMISRGMNAEKYNYIPNGVVVGDWGKNSHCIPDTHRAVMQNLKVNNKFIIGYAGGHALSNALETVVYAAEIIQSTNIVIVLVGDGVEKMKLKELAMEKAINNVVFLPSIVKDQIPDLLNYFDACLISWTQSSLYRFGVSPNKIFDYMMAKKPIVQSIDAGNDMVLDANCGISTPPESPTLMANAFISLSQKTQEELQILGNNGYEYVRNTHDVSKLAKKFLTLIDKY